jgi:hypothetical protein
MISKGNSLDSQRLPEYKARVPSFTSARRAGADSHNQRDIAIRDGIGCDAAFTLGGLGLLTDFPQSPPLVLWPV